MNNIITARNIVKRFAGGKTALDDVTVEVPRGGIYGLLGPNGAGKTTLIRILNHITAPDTGEVTFDGHALTQDDVMSIGYLPEERGLYKKMKVGEQVVFFARLKGLSSAEATKRARWWMERLDIIGWWGKKVEELSKGMAQKIQFVITVLHEPKLLIFDEPFSGFDPINVNVLKEEILRLKGLGATVIFSSHNMASVEEICDNITLINNGHNILTGNVNELRRQFSDGRYSLDFRGDGASLATALEGLTREVTVEESQLPGAQRINMRLADGATVREVIGAANAAVELEALNPARMSLNDIFIETVQRNNSNKA